MALADICGWKRTATRDDLGMDSLKLKSKGSDFEDIHFHLPLYQQVCVLKQRGALNLTEMYLNNLLFTV